LQGYRLQSDHISLPTSQAQNLLKPLWPHRLDPDVKAFVENESDEHLVVAVPVVVLGFDLEAQDPHRLDHGRLQQLFV
jgi:hypothetical protein